MPAPTDQELLDDAKTCLQKVLQHRQATTIDGTQWSYPTVGKLRELISHYEAKIARAAGGGSGARVRYGTVRG